jgi:hypothetical protein
MAWVRIDDGFPDHPKVLRIPLEAKPEALALQVLALCYSSRYLTDGKLPQHVVRVLLAGFPRAEELPKLMVDAGLWEHDGQAAGDYVIHDYLEYNPSKRQVLRLRSKRQASGKQGGLMSGKQRASKAANLARPVLKQTSSSRARVPSPPVPLPSPEELSSPSGDEAAAFARNGFASWPPEWEPIKARIQTMPFLTRHQHWLVDLNKWKSEDEAFSGVPAGLDYLVTEAAAYCEREGYKPRTSRGLWKKLHNCMEFTAKKVEREAQRAK